MTVDVLYKVYCLHPGRGHSSKKSIHTERITLTDPTETLPGCYKEAGDHWQKLHNQWNGNLYPYRYEVKYWYER